MSAYAGTSGMSPCGLRATTLWGVVGLIGQAAFTAGWAVSETWQRPGYSWVADTISDMQAATAPHVWFPILCFALGGAASCCFLLFGLRPTLARAGRTAAYAPWVLAGAALALGNSFPLIPCQVGAACSARQQLLSAGGLADAVAAGLALLVVSFSPAPISRRLRAVPAWLPFRPVALGAEKICPACFLLFSLSSLSGLAEGLAERVLVTACALWMAALAAGCLSIARRTERPAPAGAPSVGQGAEAAAETVRP